MFPISVQRQEEGLGLAWERMLLLPLPSAGPSPHHPTLLSQKLPHGPTLDLEQEELGKRAPVGRLNPTPDPSLIPHSTCHPVPSPHSLILAPITDLTELPSLSTIHS